MNNRLNTISGMVKNCSKVVDIGTDHALLPVLLIQSGKADFVYACDNKTGPLESAAKTIAMYHLQKSIKPVLSDGFTSVSDDIDAAIISGIGWKKAQGILQGLGPRFNRLQQLVIEVNDDPESLRAWISGQSFVIDDERYIFDQGHDYIAVSCMLEKGAKLSEKEIMLGPVLMRKKETAYLSFLRRKMNHLGELLPLKNEGDPDKAHMERLLNAIKSFLDE